MEAMQTLLMSYALMKKSGSFAAKIQADVDAWLDDHPEATTTVEDGAITRAKLDTGLQNKIDAAGGAIAPIEASTTASTAHAKDSYFILNGVLYQTATDIASGGTIVTSGSGQNCKAVSAGIGGEVSSIKSVFINSMNDVLGDYFETSFVLPDLNITENKYINTAGGIGSENGFMYGVFPITQGDTVNVKSTFSGTICVIGFSESESFASCTSKVNETSSGTEKECKWTADATGYCVVCGKKGTVKVTQSKSTYAASLETMLKSGYLHTYGTTITSGNYSTLLPDLNNAPQNTIIEIASGLSSIAHVPQTTYSGGALITFYPKYNIAEGALQLFIPSGGTAIYFRNRWADWNNWKTLATSDMIPKNLNVLPAFKNITCCGDSLTYSQVYTGASTSRQAYVTYPQALAKITGTDVTQYAAAGYSAVQWWTVFSGNITQKDNQLAIIYLGTNEGLTDTLATDAPGTNVADYDQTTNTGAYASIVKSFIDAGAKVVLVKCYTSSGTLSTTNNVIKQIADKFNCGLVDNERLSDHKYHYYPDRSGENSVHYNDLGYSAFATYLMNQIANMGDNYLKFIIPN